jgi:hypothetical protein
LISLTSEERRTRPHMGEDSVAAPHAQAAGQDRAGMALSM